MALEKRYSTDECRLQLRILRVRNQDLVNSVDNSLVIRNFIVDVSRVECFARERPLVSRSSSFACAFNAVLVSLSAGVTFSFAARASTDFCNAE